VTDALAQIPWTEGAFRIRSPENTWEIIQPMLADIGCTRVGDLTHLDPAGIPVHVAIRPAAASLATSHGKGLTPALSRVSAAMESIETWYAEQPLPVAVGGATHAMLAAELDYPLEALEWAAPSLLHDRFPLQWVGATTLLTRRPTLVPRDLVAIDRLLGPGVWRPRLFQVSTNGLASGNDLDEAVLHGLCELVEREAVARSAHQLQRHPVDVDALDASVRELVERITDTSRGFLRLYRLPNPVGLPCYGAVTRDDTLPMPFGGFGCHPDSSIAAVRAVTEAVQSRVALIAGSRDDLEYRLYRELKLRRPTPAPPAVDQTTPPPASMPLESIQQGVEDIAQRVRDVTGYEPAAVVHSHPEDPVQVVRVVAPGLRDHTMRDLRLAGALA
jgi:ribosomal protein S12 methylthiotransferase accessory factor